MGLFDFFKKKNSDKNSDSEQAKGSLYSSISKYNEYIINTILLHQQGDYAPISAYEKANADIVGFIYMNGDESYTLTAQEVVDRMEERLEKRLANNELKSYTIFYHSQFANNGNHKLATTDNELKAITIAYHFKNEPKGKIALPYKFDAEGVTYQNFADFTQPENSMIFDTKLVEGKDYFTDRVEIKAPETENSIGLKIKKSNNNDLHNTWCGICGFDNFRNREGSDELKIYFNRVFTQVPVINKGDVAISQLNFNDVTFKGILFKGIPETMMPVIKTNYVIDVENTEINEWENVNNVEAVVSASGRDTFGISYFATDYAENKSRYQLEKYLNVKISGIAFVLDIHKKDNGENSEGSQTNLSPDFTGYMPNNDLPDYACFDFIGLLEDFKETSLLDDNSLQGYIMRVKLINNPDIPDFFTIDMYVVKENMRFNDLIKGMKLTGMFQMQGQIADK